MSVTICYLLLETITNNYKIGQSKNVLSRFQSHLTSNIHLELVGITSKFETDLHKEFSEFRLQREWFNLCRCDKSKKQLLSYFVEYNDTNLNYIKKEVEYFIPIAAEKRELTIRKVNQQPSTKIPPKSLIGDLTPLNNIKMKKEIVKLTELQNEILILMESQSTFDNPSWGFSAMGFREVAKIINKRSIATSNAMRKMLVKGIFFDSTSKDRWDDTTFFLANPKYSDKPGNKYNLN